jgi:hypothetical protein
MNQMSLFAAVRPQIKDIPFEPWNSDEALELRARPVEHLKVMHKRMPHGCALCEIKLCEGPQGWHWSTGYWITGNAMTGRGGQIHFGRVAQRRADALTAAINDLEHDLERYTEINADARAALTWAWGLQ